MMEDYWLKLPVFKSCQNIVIILKAHECIQFEGQCFPGIRGQSRLKNSYGAEAVKPYLVRAGKNSPINSSKELGTGAKVLGAGPL